jgi:hypothetical protein
MRFEPSELSGPELALQREVREFLAAELPRGTFEPGLGMDAPRDKEFSRKLGARGWLGMGLPAAYGGGERTAVDRFVVVEELLRWGAPVGHHWFADRQSGAVIARFGTHEQRLRFLPGICAGELAFCVGMSEPDSGSDLASVKTRALPSGDGWSVNGTKVWTSGAQGSDWLIALVRTSDAPDRRDGLSQMIIGLHAPGVQVSPIPLLTGEPHFCEVSLTDVTVPAEQVLGELGHGWAQVTSELVYERAGPERWLSTYILVEQYLREHGNDRLDEAGLRFLGSTAGQLWTLRQLSLSIARSLDRGQLPAVEASMVKEMATRFEQDLLEHLRALVEIEPCPASDSLFERLLANAILTAPSFTLRGGTIEILRSVVSKGLAHV